MLETLLSSTCLRTLISRCAGENEELADKWYYRQRTATSRSLVEDNNTCCCPPGHRNSLFWQAIIFVMHWFTVISTAHETYESSLSSSLWLDKAYGCMNLSLETKIITWVKWITWMSSVPWYAHVISNILCENIQEFYLRRHNLYVCVGSHEACVWWRH